MKCIYPVMLLIIIFASDKIFAQEQDSLYKKYSVNEGLSQSTVYCIIQDDKGFIWLGTQNGLNRFDGYDFDNIRITKNGNNILENRINCIEKDNQGNLWVGTYFGLYIYDTHNERFDYNYFSDSNTIFKNKKISGLFSDSIYMYVITQNAILRTSIKKGKTEIIQAFSNNKGKAILPFYKTPMIKKKDLVYFGVNKGLYVLDKKTDSINIDARYNNIKINAFYDNGRHIMKATDKIDDTLRGNLFSDTTVYSIERVKDEIWVGTEYGLYTIDTNFNTNNIKRKTKFPNDRYFDFYKDKSDNLWIATYSNGVLVFDCKDKKFEKNEFCNKNINSIYKNNDTLWMGTWHKGLFVYKNDNRILVDECKKIGDFVSVITPINNEIWIVASDNNYNNNHIYIWNNNSFTELGDCISIDDKSLINFEGNRIYKIFHDEKDNIWIGTTDGLFKFKPNSNVCRIKKYDYSFITSITQKNNNELLIGTYNGLYVYYYDIDSLIKNIDVKLKSNSIHCIKKDKNSNFWISTIYGLNKLDRNLIKMEEFTKDNGLSNNFLYDLLEDSKSNLWMSSNNGLGKINIDSNKISSYTTNDGINNLEFNVGASFKDDSGYIYFGGIDGLYYFHQDSIMNDDFEPPIHITNFINIPDSIYYKYPSNNSQIELDYNNNSFIVCFTALDYTDPFLNQYEYKLEGYDEKWKKTTGKDPKAVYTNIPHGDYIFKIKGTNNDGVWNVEETILLIKIRTPWDKSWWFLSIEVIFILLILLLFYLNIKKRTKILEEKRKKRELEKEKIKLKVELEKEKEKFEATQQELIESKTQAAKGEFIAIISHEINTPLEVGSIGITTIKDNTEELRDKFERNILSKSYLQNYLEPVVENSILIFKSLKNAARLIKSLKEISRDQMSGISREIIIKDFLYDLFNTLKPLWQNSELEFNIECKPETIKVKTYPGAISQIFTNLITNSIRHGFDNFSNRRGGKIDIKINRYSDRLFIKYKDNGQGIKHEHLNKIFSPYFSTKEGAGSGLGLSIIKKLIENEKTFNGKINYTSKPGQGVEFVINLKIN